MLKITEGRYDSFHKFCHWHVCLITFFVLMEALTFFGCSSEENSSTLEQPSSKEHIPSKVEVPPIDFQALLQATRNGQEAQTLAIDHYGELAETSPLWPIFTFLQAEVFRLQKNKFLARQGFRNLVKWAVTNPYGDGWGGSGLVCVALWRCLQAANQEPNPDPKEAAELIEAVQYVMTTRLARGMFSTPVLRSLPKLEEEIARGLAILAWSANLKTEAQQLFLDYLRLATTSELSTVEKELKQQILMSGLASEDQLNLFLGKRLYKLTRHDDAINFLKEAQKSKNLQVHAEASLYLAYILSISQKGATRGEVADIFSSVYEESTNPQIAQKALFKMAGVLYREGEGRDVEEALKTYENLIQEFPRGEYADDALYKLARHYQDQGDIDKALHYYERLQNFKGKNDWTNLSLFQPAMALYTRNHPKVMAKAYTLLQRLKESQPYGPLYLNTLFWLGRMDSERGNKKEAQKYFKQIIEESPYDYYAIRARMHLHIDDQASQSLWPDPQTQHDLHEAYRKSYLAISMTGDSPYHLRLQQAIETGLYAAAFHAASELQKLFPSRRLENLSLTELDESGMIASISLLLALRQDAFAAKDTLASSENKLQVAGTIANFVNDWPLVMIMIFAPGEPYEKRITAQRDIRYLATAYPLVFEEYIKEMSKAYAIPPELLYSVMRRESLFYPTALSVSGAMGLFQFMPRTFNSLDKRWNLLEAGGVTSKEAFLFDPQRSIPLGARWFKEELLARQDGNLFFAIMEHNAGYPAVKAWVDNWEKTGLNKDIEYMVETGRFAQTRIFVRGVLTDMMIMEAAGLLREKKN